MKKYQQYKKYGEGYSKSRDRERFYENHESQMIILDAAIRFIRSKGINPDKITYEQVAEGIEKLNTRASDRKQRHRQLSAELKGMEKGEAYLTRLKPYWQKFKYQLDYIPFKP